MDAEQKNVWLQLNFLNMNSSLVPVLLSEVCVCILEQGSSVTFSYRQLLTISGISPW